MITVALCAAAFFVGMIAERIRKTSDLRMDADRGVTFVGGKPHVFRRYGPEQNYDQ